MSSRPVAAKRASRAIRPRKGECPNVVVISDPHCGCRLGLCPPEGIELDDGGHYKPSALQLKVWAHWREFWDEWVPQVTHGEPFALVLNGDAVEGVHHGSVTQISHNLTDQARLAEAVLGPVARAARGGYYHVRGTEAHVGASAQNEERLAASLGAIPNDVGQHAHWDLWKRLGSGLIHFNHHIGTTGSSAYEATAVGKELVEAFVEAGRWGDEVPQVVVRSHRHRYMEVRMATDKGYGISLVTPGWQLKTPFAHKIPGARVSQPQIGGVIVRVGDEELHTRAFVRRIERPREM